MARHGWIYLRIVDGKGYCIGKTEDIARRDAEYTKENPFIETVCTFAVNDVDRVERILISLTAHLRLLPNSREWLHQREEVVRIVEVVKKRFALMTYSEWRKLVRQRKERRLQQQIVDHDQIEQEAGPRSQELSQPKPSAPPIRPCPRCRTLTSWMHAVGYICRNCNHRFR
jgi:hypothetical protein